MRMENAPVSFKSGQANHDYQMNRSYRIHSPEKFIGGVASIVVGVLSLNYTNALAIGDINGEFSELIITLFAISMMVAGAIYVYLSFFGDMKVYYKRSMGICGITGDAVCTSGDCRKCTFALVGAMVDAKTD